MILVDSRQPIEEKGTIYQFRQSQRETAPNLSQNNNPNFGRAVERERSELRNASPKERKSQVSQVRPLAFGPVHIQNTDSILDNEGLRPL